MAIPGKAVGSVHRWTPPLSRTGGVRTRGPQRDRRPWLRQIPS